MLRANLSWNDWKEHSGPGSFDDPTRRVAGTSCSGNCNGEVVERSAGSGAFANVFINSKWSANVTGLYQLPWEVTVAGSFTSRQGYPTMARAEVETDANPGGVSSVILHEIGDDRYDNVRNLDLRVAKEFRIAGRVGVTVSADLFNVTNERTVLQRDMLLFSGDESTETGGEITELQSPRVWRFGARLTF
jgi:hypothetical protein